MSDSGDWLVCPHVLELLSRLDEAVRAAVASSDPATREIGTHLISRGGKHLRPALLLLAAEFGRGEEEKLLWAAAALELIHVASLYHDDVMDRAMTRRGGASANAVWGNSLATTGGTLLFACASVLLSSLGDEANKMASEAAARLCTGQLREVENAYSVELSEKEHLEILALKTATLFELPCRLGAHLSGVAAGHPRMLLGYAQNLGLAFQLADDALDLAGDVAQLGKATLNDVREGVYSFPVIHALQQDRTEAARLQALLRQDRLTESELQDVVVIVQNTGAVAEGLRKAHEYAGRAQEHLRGIPEGTARESLQRLAEFAVSRSH